MLPNPLETVKLATFTKEILKSSLIHSLQYLIYKGLKNYIFLSLLDYIFALWFNKDLQPTSNCTKNIWVFSKFIVNHPGLFRIFHII